MPYQPITVRPANGGDLVSHLSTDDVGPANYTVKRDFRRDMDREVRREGHILFAPVTIDSSSSGGSGGSESDASEPTGAGLLSVLEGESGLGEVADGTIIDLGAQLDIDPAFFTTVRFANVGDATLNIEVAFVTSSGVFSWDETSPLSLSIAAGSFEDTVLTIDPSQDLGVVTCEFTITGDASFAFSYAILIGISGGD